MTTPSHTLNLPLPQHFLPCSRLLSLSAAHPVFVSVGLTPLSTRASADNSHIPSLSSETQRIRDSMEDRQTYANVQLVKPDSRFPSRTEPDVSYAKPNIKGLSVPRTDADRLTSTYSELNIGRDEPLIDEDEGPSIASRPGELRVTAQTVSPDEGSRPETTTAPLPTDAAWPAEFTSNFDVCCSDLRALVLDSPKREKMTLRIHSVFAPRDFKYLWKVTLARQRI
ncbi:uncharacterized protein [Mobula birostris]|uniref:uncharacterized protein n=1 Tax=Mobula birostris TaxID=1983395 RepID=UPI003B27D75A